MRSALLAAAALATEAGAASLYHEDFHGKYGGTPQQVGNILSLLDRTSQGQHMLDEIRKKYLEYMNTHELAQVGELQQAQIDALQQEIVTLTKQYESFLGKGKTQCSKEECIREGIRSASHIFLQDIKKVFTAMPDTYGNELQGKMIENWDTENSLQQTLQELGLDESWINRAYAAIVTGNTENQYGQRGANIGPAVAMENLTIRGISEIRDPETNKIIAVIGFVSACNNFIIIQALEIDPVIASRGPGLWDLDLGELDGTEGKGFGGDLGDLGDLGGITPSATRPLITGYTPPYHTTPNFPGGFTGSPNGTPITHTPGGSTGENALLPNPPAPVPIPGSGLLGGGLWLLRRRKSQK